MIFTDQQVEQMLKGVHPSRVKNDPKGMSYLEQHDVRAHMNRLFGFGMWDQHLTRLECVFEEPSKVRDAKPDRWDVCYSASVKLTVHGENDGGYGACMYEDGATGFAQNQTRGEAHDLALKSAISTALKRAATSLGDQFGLSLYAGTPNAIVKGVIGWEPKSDAAMVELQELCEEKGWPLGGAVVVLEKHFGKHINDCPGEELKAFVSLLRSGAITIQVDEAATA